MSAYQHTLPAGRGRGRRSSLRSWRWGDRVVYLLAWLSGLSLCVVALALVLYLFVRGVEYVSPSLILTRPTAGIGQNQIGGILDPLLGTLLLVALGTAIATPIGVASAVWIVEYGRPRWLARVVESSVEIVAGTPDIVIAILALALFQVGALSFLSFTASGGGVYGRSFLTAGAAVALLALPPIFLAARDGLEALPGHQREGAFALGKTRIATIRRVLLPGIRPNIATGITLGMGRIVGDTAIVFLLLGVGAAERIEPQGGVPGLNVLRGTGSTLTSYIYSNSPAGEGNAPQKAYAAAFVLLAMVLGLNALAGVVSRRGSAGGMSLGDRVRLGGWS
jgi:phosphate transport system permease protein